MGTIKQIINFFWIDADRYCTAKQKRIVDTYPFCCVPMGHIKSDLCIKLRRSIILLFFAKIKFLSSYRKIRQTNQTNHFALKLIFLFPRNL